ncbi:MAG: TonB-dependent receptor [Woeseia sp.]
MLFVHIRTLVFGALAGLVVLTITLAETVEAQEIQSNYSNEIEEIVVTGSSIRRAESEFPALPVDTVSSETLQRTQGASLGEVLQELPIIAGSVLNPTTDEYNGGRSTINIRGVGDEYTLVLLNGRRFGGENVPDIGSIMPDAVERVEILKGGASSIYGSDAVAGVVNVKLRENFSGIRLDASYGDTTASDTASSLKTAMLVGIQEEPFTLIVGGAYHEQGELSKFDRTLTASRDYRAFGGIDRRSGGFGFPHLIFVPDGSGGDDVLSIDVSRLEPGASSDALNDYVPYDRETQALSFNEVSVVPEQERFSGFWSATYDLGQSGAELYTSGIADRRVQTFVSTEASGASVNVPATNPHNPFGQDVFVNYLFGPNELPPITYEFDTTNFQGAFGIQGDLDRFQYDIGYSYYRQRIFETVLTDVDLNAVRESVDRQDESAFNPFCYWCNSPEQLQGFAPTAITEEVNRVQSVDAKLTGDLFTWRPGTVQFALGAERRWVEFYFKDGYGNFDYWETGRGGGGNGSGDRSVSAGYGEVRVPLREPASVADVVGPIEMSAAVRHESYSDFGSSTVGSISALASFIEGRLLTRLSYSESFRAPSVDALNDPITTNTLLTQGFFFDPVRMGILPFDTITGGNPDLEPEAGESINIGIVVQSSDRNTKLSIDWFDLEISERIGTPDIQSIFDGENAGGSITRDPATLYPTLDIRFDNIGERKVRGVDVSGTYQFQTDRVGMFSANIFGTYLTDFEDVVGTDRFDQLGQFSQGAIGTIPKLQAQAQVVWLYENFETSLAVNYTGDYTEESNSTAARDAGTYTTADLFFSMNLGGDGQRDTLGFLNQFELYAGLKNMFDQEPNFIAASSDGYDRLIADIRGRTVYAGVRLTL